MCVKSRTEENGHKALGTIFLDELLIPVQEQQIHGLDQISNYLTTLDHSLCELVQVIAQHVGNCVVLQPLPEKLGT